MHLSLPLVRTLFLGICVLFTTIFMTALPVEGNHYVNLGIGAIAGLAFGGALIWLEMSFARFSIRSLTVAILGLLVGYLLSEVVMLIANKAVDISGAVLPPLALDIIRAGIFLCCIYIGLVATARAADDWAVAIPFVELRPENQKKNDLITDLSVLLDSRIIDLAASGLLDRHLIIPQFLIKELQSMAELSDESARAKARRSLETIKKLESMPTLGLRFVDTDFPEYKNGLPKLIQLARHLGAGIIIADNARLHQSTQDGVRLINIHSLSIALKPVAQSGEPIDIKIQRYGKEPRQGVGYLDDGTMVVVNGGAEFIGETIRAQVLSVKHTTSGRMIFCNALDESFLSEPCLAAAHSDAAPSPKDYFTFNS